MLVKIVHVKYCPANWQTAYNNTVFQPLGVSHPPHPPSQQLRPCIQPMTKKSIMFLPSYFFRYFSWLSYCFAGEGGGGGIVIVQYGDG